MSESGSRQAEVPAPDAVPLPSVSVALCTRNGMPYVTEQVQSILDQTVEAAEIVLSDDASTDGTVEAVQGLVERHHEERRTSVPRLVVLLNDPALGVTANFEQAVRACSAELIALCDQDDVWRPGRLDQITREFRERPSLTLLHHDARLVDESGTPLGTTLARAIGFTASERRKEAMGDAFDVLLRRNTVTGATTVFRHELLAAAAPFPAAWVHDEWLAMIASIVGHVDYLAVPLIDYRQHASNQIGASKPTLADKVSRVVEPRTARNRRLAARAQALAERVGHISEAPDRVLALAHGKVDHERWRSSLPASRIRRLLPVLFAAVRGRYHRFGRTRYDVARDLLQPSR